MKIIAESIEHETLRKMYPDTKIEAECEVCDKWFSTTLKSIHEDNDMTCPKCKDN